MDNNQNNNQAQSKEQIPFKGEVQMPQKLILIGNSEVGKSCILEYFIRNQFSGKMISTIGHEFKKEKIVVDDIKVTFLIWDTAGQEKFRPIIKSYFKGTKAAFIVFGLDDKKSQNDLRYWFKEIEKGVDTPGIPKIILANKVDLVKEEQIDKEEIEAYKNQYANKLYYTSAKTGKNIQEAFNEMARLIIKKNKDSVVYGDSNNNNNNKNKQEQNLNGTSKLKTNKKKQKKEGCC
ncbi:P-loop containing nucleoside triphosphate hydrolase [Pseudocohnilembus persalinus]|uniref:p-loop containing nucleoside triphosphate hydrolase n=1 Tax=Pseudocohnilembus persalinus TaxID=266149 RepID=A0A0V0R886_PSEPJ|nr:P-loop containing nucleoside triphosphate hydrolase [Pseudocohnilembus persalinus]|eukprot:KRX10576.1 P-loop containing nucleoside triphosphate hydrolase [Pseudocohnilembus persalinus]